MAWYDERQLGWERDTGDSPGVWTLKRLNAWFASAEEILQAEFGVKSVPFPASSVSELTRNHLREVACIFGEDVQWTCIWTGKAFYYTNRKLLDHTNRRLLDAAEQRGSREVLKRISKLGRHRALALVLLMRAHFIAETYKSRTGNEERLFDLAKDVEETGAGLIESIDHIGQTFASRYHAKKFLRTEGLVGWSTEVGLLDTLAMLRAHIQVTTVQSASAWRQRQKHHRALEPQEGNLPDTFYAAFDKVADLLRPEGRKKRMVMKTKELFDLIGVEVNEENERKAWMRRRKA